MRSTVIRRSAAVAGSVLSLALVVACDSSGSGTDEAKASSSASGAASSASPVVTPLTAAELKKVSLTTADIDGYSVKTPGKGDVYSQATVKIAKTACAPVAYALSGAALGNPSVTEQRQLTSKSKAGSASASADELEAAYDVSVSLVTLSSYTDQAAAEAILKSVTDAGTVCAGGFTATAAGEEEKVTKLVTDIAPKGADEAVALTATAVQDDSTGPMKVVVLRKGATVAYFTAISVASFISGDDFEFPTEIVDAQLGKLS